MGKGVGWVGGLQMGKGMGWVGGGVVGWWGGGGPPSPNLILSWVLMIFELGSPSSQDFELRVIVKIALV